METCIEQKGEYLLIRRLGENYRKEWYVKGSSYKISTKNGEVKLNDINILDLPEGSFLEIKDNGLVPIKDKKTIEDMAMELMN